MSARPADKNGLGLTPLDAEKRLSALESILTVLHDNATTYQQWRKLIVQHEVKGIQVHDGRIAATMQVYGVERLLTYHPRDFKRYQGISPVQPEDLVSPHVVTRLCPSWIFATTRSSIRIGLSVHATWIRI